jgi:hypothetical protein
MFPYGKLQPVIQAQQKLENLIFQIECGNFSRFDKRKCGALIKTTETRKS